MMISARKLVKMARKWQNLAAVGRKKRICYGRRDDDIEKDVGSRGHFVVYSEDGKRLMIPLSYLKQEVFREVLRMSEEEFGVGADGAMRVPCDRVLMDYNYIIWIWVMRNGISREFEQALLMSLWLQ